MTTYLYNVGAALSCLANAILGGAHNEPLSARIGRSIQSDGFWSRVPMTPALALHFLESAARH